MNEKVIKQAKEWIQSIIIALLIVIPLSYAVVPTEVIGKSMQPTLQNKDILIVEKISKYMDKYKRGDIVIFDAKPIENELYVKRVIGLPGETVEIKNEKVYINGQELKENYLKNGTITDGQIKLKVKPDELFVLGDNRENSNDSRAIGPISIKKIKGKSLFRIFPFNKIKIFQ